ncbi:hypothetical protein B0H13DRAFT_1907472 [Mycena leptocephala]|nr:hypothetical protein B0H13DRAFT_1907472 [Mycena leptocephala]
MEETGTYESSDADGTTSIRAFVNGSPRSPDEPRAPTQVDLVLPPTEAFYKPGPKSVDRYSTGQEIWTSWIDGEAVYNDAGIQTGKKPPLNLVEQYLQNKWRTPDDHKERGIAAQHWEDTGRYQNEGMNWLRQEVATLRKQAAQPVDGAGTSTSSVVSTTSTPPLPASESIQSQNLRALAPAFEEDLTKRKRAPAADSRRTKKRKKVI